ncbi:MAG: uncharacterized protein K0R24_2333 [Gammaproteobacteria bacterium]|jgi:hypothetical protein|nr:uncharacterized protein [Gammaproteobacteria bacterium]
MLKNIFKNESPSFSGHGYLNEVRHYENDQFDASFDLMNVGHRPGDSGVFAKCRFNMDAFPILGRLDRYLSQKKTVILKFDAKYDGFQLPGDDLEGNFGFLVHYGKLLKIDEAYVEEVGVFYPDKFPRDDDSSYSNTHGFKRCIHITWRIEDILFVRPRLTLQQACEVLQEIDRNRNANVGVNWEVIKTVSDRLFPDTSSENS